MSMLSRTADNLFWMARYTERAENTARMLDVNAQMSLLPQSDKEQSQGWASMIGISELDAVYLERYQQFDAPSVIQFMVSDLSNPASIVSSITNARESARAVRGSLTTEVWETLNTTWLELQKMLQTDALIRDPSQFFEWVKFRSHLSRGVTIGTMLRDEAKFFLRIGTFLERADNTARLLDVKYYGLPTHESQEIGRAHV